MDFQDIYRNHRKISAEHLEEIWNPILKNAGDELSLLMRNDYDREIYHTAFGYMVHALGEVTQSNASEEALKIGDLFYAMRMVDHIIDMEMTSSEDEYLQDAYDALKGGSPVHDGLEGQVMNALRGISKVHAFDYRALEDLLDAEKEEAKSSEYKEHIAARIGVGKALGRLYAEVLDADERYVPFLENWGVVSMLYDSKKDIWEDKKRFGSVSRLHLWTEFNKHLYNMFTDPNIDPFELFSAVKIPLDRYKELEKEVNLPDLDL